jgi:hypothetical protein
VPLDICDVTFILFFQPRLPSGVVSRHDRRIVTAPSPATGRRRPGFARQVQVPILGFGGFPVFAVQCFIMYVAVRSVPRDGTSRPIAL